MLSSTEKFVIFLYGIGIVLLKNYVKVHMNLDEFTAFEVAVSAAFLSYVLYLGFKKLYEHI